MAVLLLARPGWAAGCLKDPGDGDAAQIRAVRAEIEATCLCSTYDGSKGWAHGDYVKAAKAVIKDAVGRGALRKQCQGTVTKYYSRSCCGYAPAMHAMPCIKTCTKSGTVSCSIKKTMKSDGVTLTQSCVDGPRTPRKCVRATRTVSTPPTPMTTW